MSPMFLGRYFNLPPGGPYGPMFFVGIYAPPVWSYDFVSTLTRDGRTLRFLTLTDEFTRECLAIRVARRPGSQEVIETLAEVMVWRGSPEHLRSDNGPEFIALELRK